MMKKRLALLLVLAIVLSAFLIACTPAEDPEDPGTEDPGTEDPGTEDPGTEDPGTGEVENVLTVGITEASGNFNPVTYSSAYDGYVVDLVFEGLITRGRDGEFHEGEAVADSWEYSNDDKTITFKMKEDRVFSDGTPVTANDVVFTYKVLADPSYTGRYGSAVKDMEGYEEYFNKETEEFKGVVALDEYTVQFNFKEALRVNFTQAGYAIMPEHHYGANYEYGDVSGVMEFTSDVMGSGPYKVVEFAEKEYIFLDKNEHWTGEGYEIEELILKFVEMTTEMVELTTGQVDLLTGVIDPRKIKDATDAGKEYNRYARSGYGYVKTNHESGITADEKVRQALYYSFDRDDFVNNYFLDEESGEILANTQAHPFSQISWAVDDALLNELNNYDYDMEKAAALLDEAGWIADEETGARSKDGERMIMNIAAMPDHDILDTLIPMWSRDWGAGLGIQLNVAYLEFNTMLDYVIYNSDANVDSWNAFFLAVTISSPDPHVQYTTFHSDYIGNGMDNTSRYNNPEVDALFDEAKSIMDVDEAKVKYREIVKILNDEAVMMPVYANIYFDMYDPKLKNFDTDSLFQWVAALRDATIE